MKHSGGNIGVALLVLVGGCSPVVEATRPDPVDLSQFAVGESRVQVVEQIGTPTATVKDGADSRDVYKLMRTAQGSGRRVSFRGPAPLDGAGNRK